MYTFNLNYLTAVACHLFSKGTQTEQEMCLYFSAILFPQNVRIKTLAKLKVFSPLPLFFWGGILILTLGIKSWAAFPAQ